VPSTEIERVRDWQIRFGQANAAAAADGIDVLRKLNDEWMAGRGTVADDVHVEQVEIAKVRCERVTVSAAAGPTILFCHSGGLMLGSPADAREWLSRLVGITGGEVITPAYRLAPEHAFPAQLDDVLAVYRALRPENLVVMGESAGGFLAARLLAALAAAGDPMPAAAVLLSPMLDLELGGRTLDSAGDPFVSRPMLEMMVSAFLQGGDPARHSALNTATSGFPPLLLQVGTAEAMYDDGRRYAEDARAKGVDVTFEPWEDMLHLWHGFPELPESDAAIRSIAAFLARS
jgi:acetyl esterase/lipase